MLVVADQPNSLYEDCSMFRMNEAGNLLLRYIYSRARWHRLSRHNKALIDGLRKGDCECSSL